MFNFTYDKSLETKYIKLHFVVTTYEELKDYEYITIDDKKLKESLNLTEGYNTIEYKGFTIDLMMMLWIILIWKKVK